MIGASEVTVVIRSVGERTEAACRDLLARQVPEDHVVIVSNAPFSATLADCYRVGIERGLAWTLCIDADVLVAPGVVERLLGIAAEADPAVCEIQGMVLDKFFGVRRPAGNHLYRTSLLPKALQLIPQEGQAIRPEHHTISRLMELGHPWVELPLVVGLHDFEQYDRDIFRKCYVHARKFDKQMHLLVDYWRRMAPQDKDYRVALGGLAAGITTCADVRVDVRRDSGFDRWAQAEAWVEKPALEPGRITPEQVERTLATWASPGGELQRSEDCYTRQIVHDGKPAPAKAKGARPEVGLLRMLPWATGRALGKVGRRLERLASE